MTPTSPTKSAVDPPSPAKPKRKRRTKAQMEAAKAAEANLTPIIIEPPTDTTTASTPPAATEPVQPAVIPPEPEPPSESSIEEIVRGDFILYKDGRIEKVQREGNSIVARIKVGRYFDGEHHLEWASEAAMEEARAVGSLLRAGKRRADTYSIAGQSNPELPPGAPPRPKMSPIGVKTERLVRWLAKYAWPEFVATYGVTSNQKVEVPVMERQIVSVEDPPNSGRFKDKAMEVKVGSEWKYPARCQTVLTFKPKRGARGAAYDDSVPAVEPEGSEWKEL